MMIRNIVYLLAPIFLLSLTACSAHTDTNSAPEIGTPEFSLDSRTLFFSFCQHGRCDLVSCSLDSKEFSRVAPTEDIYRFEDAGLGPENSKIVAMLQYRSGEFTSYPQIVQIDFNTQTYRRLTNSPSHKYGPNFSFDGSQVAYVESHGQRTWANGSPRANRWDIHVLKLATGQDTKATNFCFYAVSSPYFTPDTGDLVFSGEGPLCNYPRLGEPHETDGYKEYKNRFGDDQIIRLGPQRERLEPWIHTVGQHSRSPHISKNGEVLFVSRTNYVDGIKQGNYNYDLFLKRGESIKRLTQLHTIIYGTALSPDGNHAAYISDPQRDHQRTLWLMNIETQQHEQISLQPLIAGMDQIPVISISEQR